jgi:hypothetical protein
MDGKEDFLPPLLQTTSQREFPPIEQNKSNKTNRTKPIEPMNKLLLNTKSKSKSTYTSNSQTYSSYDQCRLQSVQALRFKMSLRSESGFGNLIAFCKAA